MTAIINNYLKPKKYDVILCIENKEKNNELEVNVGDLPAKDLKELMSILLRELTNKNEPFFIEDNTDSIGVRTIVVTQGTKRVLKFILKGLY